MTDYWPYNSNNRLVILNTVSCPLNIFLSIFAGHLRILSSEKPGWYIFRIWEHGEIVQISEKQCGQKTWGIYLVSKLYYTLSSMLCHISSCLSH